MSKSKKIFVMVVVGFVGMMLIGFFKALIGAPVFIDTILFFALVAGLRAIWITDKL